MELVGYRRHSLHSGSWSRHRIWPGHRITRQTGLPVPVERIERIATKGLLVQLNSKALNTARQDEFAALSPQGCLHHVRKDALVSFGPDRLKNKKIRDGGSIVHIHEGRNRPVGVVRSHADVVSFGKSSNSLHSRDTTRVDKIALEDIDSLVLEERSNAVDRSPPLSCGNGN